MKVGGQILWNVTPICETSQTYYLMGRRPMKDVLGNHLKDQLFRLVHWLSITLFLRKTTQDSINLERKSYLGCSLDTLRTREDFGGRKHWGAGNDGRIGKLLQKTQCKVKSISQRKWKNSSRRWMDESNFLEEIRNWEHPPWYGNTQFEEKVKDIF